MKILLMKLFKQYWWIVLSVILLLIYGTRHWGWWVARATEDYWYTFWTALGAVGTLIVAWIAITPILDRVRIRQEARNNFLSVTVERDGIVRLKNSDSFQLEVIEILQRRYLATWFKETPGGYQAGLASEHFMSGQVDNFINKHVKDQTVEYFVKEGGDKIQHKMKHQLLNAKSIFLASNAEMPVAGSLTHFAHQYDSNETVSIVEIEVVYRTKGPGDDNAVFIVHQTYWFVGHKVQGADAYQPNDMWVLKESSSTQRLN